MCIRDSSEAGKVIVDLMIRWPRITDSVVYSRTGSRPLRGRRACHLCSHQGVWYRLPFYLQFCCAAVSIGTGQNWMETNIKTHWQTWHGVHSRNSSRFSSDNAGSTIMSQFSLDSAAVVVLVPLSPPAAGHGADISPTMLMIITSITGIPNTSENKNEFLHLQTVNRYEHRAEFNITLKHRVCGVPYCTHSSLSPIMGSYLTYWMNCVVELPCLLRVV